MERLERPPLVQYINRYFYFSSFFVPLQRLCPIQIVLKFTLTGSKASYFYRLASNSVQIRTYKADVKPTTLSATHDVTVHRPTSRT